MYTIVGKPNFYFNISMATTSKQKYRHTSTIFLDFSAV